MEPRRRSYPLTWMNGELPGLPGGLAGTGPVVDYWHCPSGEIRRIRADGSIELLARVDSSKDDRLWRAVSYGSVVHLQRSHSLERLDVATSRVEPLVELGPDGWFDWWHVSDSNLFIYSWFDHSGRHHRRSRRRVDDPVWRLVLSVQGVERELPWAINRSQMGRGHGCGLSSDRRIVRHVRNRGGVSGDGAWTPLAEVFGYDTVHGRELPPGTMPGWTEISQDGSRAIVRGLRQVWVADLVEGPVFPMTPLAGREAEPRQVTGARWAPDGSARYFGVRQGTVLVRHPYGSPPGNAHQVGPREYRLPVPAFPVAADSGWVVLKTKFVSAWIALDLATGACVRLPLGDDGDRPGDVGIARVAAG
jgi:hypothetical protein